MKISRILILTGMVILLIMQGCVLQPAKKPAAQLSAPISSKPTKTYQDLVVGFSQIGKESGWRTADTESIKQEAARLGVDLIFMDAQQEQENQIMAIRTFIAEKVDVIGISAVVETGWGNVFQEAKDAGIPVIFVDRPADVPEDQYVTYLGSDFLEEGHKAGRIMANLTNGQANIVELVGTIDSAPAVERSKGFREILVGYPNMKIIDSQSGDFTRTGGLEVMRTFLQIHGKSITAVFAQNDDMALGAIQAIQEAGLKPGVDIKVIGFDATADGFKYLISGQMNADIECNPLLAPQVYEAALKAMNGDTTVPTWVPSQEGEFFAAQGADALNAILATRKY